MTFIYSQSFKVKQISIFKEKKLHVSSESKKKKIQERKNIRCRHKNRYSLKMASEFHFVYMVNNRLSIICKVPLVSLWSYWFWRVDQTLFVLCVS